MDSTVKKKKKSNVERLFARYKTYEGAPGSPEQWAWQADKVLKPKAGGNLAILGLVALPATLEELKSIRRKVMREVHPDLGGSEEQAAKINAAFDQLAKLFPDTSKVFTEVKGLVNPPRCTGNVTKESSNHVAELKIDGERFLLYIGFDPYGRRDGNTILSRHKSSSDGRYSDRSENVPHITEKQYPSNKGTVLDGEIFLDSFEHTASIMGSISGEAIDKQRTRKLVYHVFDIPFHNGRDIRSLPLRERRAILEQVVAELNNPHIQLVTQYTSGFDAVFSEVTSKGGEGLIIKNLGSTYGNEWAKLKKSFDISCFVTGYRMGKDENYIGSFSVGVYEGSNLLEIGFVSGYACLESDIDKYVGKVIDVFAYEFTKQNKLRMPTFHRFRSDLNPEDCTVEKLKEDFTKIKKSRTKMV